VKNFALTPHFIENVDLILPDNMIEAGE